MTFGFDGDLKIRQYVNDLEWTTEDIELFQISQDMVGKSIFTEGLPIYYTDIRLFGRTINHEIELELL